MIDLDELKKASEIFFNFASPVIALIVGYWSWLPNPISPILHERDQSIEGRNTLPALLRSYQMSRKRGLTLTAIGLLLILFRKTWLIGIILIIAGAVNARRKEDA